MRAGRAWRRGARPTQERGTAPRSEPGPGRRRRRRRTRSAARDRCRSAGPRRRRSRTGHHRAWSRTARPAPTRPFRFQVRSRDSSQSMSGASSASVRRESIHCSRSHSPMIGSARRSQITASAARASRSASQSCRPTARTSAAIGACPPIAAASPVAKRACASANAARRSSRSKRITARSFPSASTSTIRSFSSSKRVASDTPLHATCWSAIRSPTVPRIARSSPPFRDEERRLGDPRLDIAAHQRPPAAILEPELVACECAERVPVASDLRLGVAIARARRGVRRDAQGIGAQLGEARAGLVELVEVVEVVATDAPQSVELDDGDPRCLERAALASAEPALRP